MTSSDMQQSSFVNVIQHGSHTWNFSGLVVNHQKRERKAPDGATVIVRLLSPTYALASHPGGVETLLVTSCY